MAEQPIIYFPEGLADRSGRRMRPSSLVRVATGDHAGLVGEVVGWGGRRGVEILVQGELDLVAVPPDRLAVVADVPARAVLRGAVIVQESDDAVVVVQPVGIQDVQPRHGDRGPFPDPRQFSTKRGDHGLQTKVDARRWGEACLEFLSTIDEEEGARLVFAHLDAPMLRRVLDEGALPEGVHRLVFVVSDQARPHEDDTAAFGELLTRWCVGGDERRLRRIGEIAPPVVLRSAPHLVTAVEQQVEPQADRILAGADVAVVVHAGGTPAMTYGVLFALQATGCRLRHLQVPWQQPVVEIDVSVLIDRAATGRGSHR